MGTKCKDLGPNFPITQAWLDGGNCSAAADLISDLKAANDGLNSQLQELQEKISSFGQGSLNNNIPLLGNQYTTGPTTDPFDGAFTAGGGAPLTNTINGLHDGIANLQEVNWVAQAGSDASKLDLAREIVQMLGAASDAADLSGGLHGEVVLKNQEYQSKIEEETKQKLDANKSLTERFIDGLESAAGMLGRTLGDGVAETIKETSDYFDPPDEEDKKRMQENAELRQQAEILKKTGVGALDENENYLGSPFREQCFIQSNIYTLIEMRRTGNFVKKIQYPDGTTQACLMAGGSPFGFINRLTQGPTTAAMFDIPHEVLSQLQPQVNLYKVVTDSDGNQVEIPFNFPKSTSQQDVKDLLNNKHRRGYGVGLKSFEWTYDGSDPFSVKKSIKAQLKIHATTFAELLRPRGEVGKYFRYADLAMKTGTIEDRVPPACNVSANDTILDVSEKLNFRLKAVVGYAIPRKLEISRRDKEAYTKAIADSFVTLELTPTIHNFDFDETGRVTFTINYLAYVEDFFDDYYYDIFASSNNNSIDAFKYRMQKAFNEASDGKQVEGYTPVPTDDGKVLKGLQERNLASLTERLLARDRMFYYQVPLKSLNKAAIGAVLPVYNGDDQIINESEVRSEITNLKNEAKKAGISVAKKNALIKEAEALQKSLDTNHLERTTAETHGTDINRTVAFFFLYDLIDVILEGIYVALNDAYPKALQDMKAAGNAQKVKDKETKTLLSMKQNFENLRVMLGPMEIANPRRKNEFFNISMGEIPISMKYYSEWMADKILSRNRTGYTLSAFLNDFIKNYLRNFLNDNACGGDKFRQRVSLNNSTISAYSPTEGFDPITLWMMGVNKGRKGNNVLDVFEVPDQAAHVRPFLNTMGSRVSVGPRTYGQALQYNYMIFFAGRTRPDELMTGDRFADSMSGIHHYIMGDSAGIVKNIRLDKKSAKGLKELRFEQEGYDGLLQLREVYNVTIDAFLLPNAFPGAYIFVDPRGFAPDTSGYEGIDPTTKKPFPVDTYELSRYGVGGYYMITKSTHTVEEGGRSTQIHASWVAAKEKPGDAEPAEDSNVESPEQGPQKCRSKRNSNDTNGAVASAEVIADTIEQAPSAGA